MRGLTLSPYHLENVETIENFCKTVATETLIETW